MNFEILKNDFSIKGIVSLKIRNVNFSAYQPINDESKSKNHCKSQRIKKYIFKKQEHLIFW